jgi:hypothetical protein
MSMPWYRHGSEMLFSKKSISFVMVIPAQFIEIQMCNIFVIRSLLRHC